METNLLGSSGLLVSAFSLGTMTFGNKTVMQAMGELGVPEAKTFVDMAIEAGINLFDTADIYSDGHSEEVLGKALAGRRQDVLIATKLYQPMGPGANDLGLSRYNITRACERSLKRLGTDYIDLYQSHGQDSMTPLEETMRAFDDLIRAGKVRYIGCSNFAAWHLMKSLATADRIGTARYVSQQVDYSLMDRDIEWELVPAGLDQGVGIMAYSPLAGGLLSGKYTSGETVAPDARGAAMKLPQDTDRAQLQRITDVMGAIGRERGVSITQVGLNWVRQQPGVSTVIIGAKSVDQLRANLGAADWRLSQEELAKLDEVSRRPPPYPFWHLTTRTSQRSPYYRAKGPLA